MTHSHSLDCLIAEAHTAALDVDADCSCFGIAPQVDRTDRSIFLVAEVMVAR